MKSVRLSITITCSHEIKAIINQLVSSTSMTCMFCTLIINHLTASFWRQNIGLPLQSKLRSGSMVTNNSSFKVMVFFILELEQLWCLFWSAMLFKTWLATLSRLGYFLWAVFFEELLGQGQWWLFLDAECLSMNLILHLDLGWGYLGLAWPWLTTLLTFNLRVLCPSLRNTFHYITHWIVHQPGINHHN